jgi:hypothetical protein
MTGVRARVGPDVARGARVRAVWQCQLEAHGRRAARVCGEPVWPGPVSVPDTAQLGFVMQPCNVAPGIQRIPVTTFRLQATSGDSSSASAALDRCGMPDSCRRTVPNSCCRSVPVRHSTRHSTQRYLPPLAPLSLVCCGAGDDAVLVSPAVAWMRNASAADRPFFAALMTSTTHANYALPPLVRRLHAAYSMQHAAYNAWLCKGPAIGPA